MAETSKSPGKKASRSAKPATAGSKRRKTAVSKAGPGAPGGDKHETEASLHKGGAKRASTRAGRKPGAAQTAGAAKASSAVKRASSVPNTAETSRTSVVGRMVKKVKEAAGNLASLAGSVVGRH